MPTLGTMAMSFSGRQSQLGDTSMTSEMWKQGRPSTTALVYSAILQFRLAVVSSQLIRTASLGQTAMQRPQPTHLS